MLRFAPSPCGSHKVCWIAPKHRFALAQVLIESPATQKRAHTVAFAVGFFALTCPSGVAIGVAINASLGNSYDPASYAIAVGVLDALAGGILIYMGLSQLVVSWVVKSKPLHRASTAVACLAFLGLAVGLVIMSIVGIWA